MQDFFIHELAGSREEALEYAREKGLTLHDAVSEPQSDTVIAPVTDARGNGAPHWPCCMGRR